MFFPTLDPSQYTVVPVERLNDRPMTAAEYERGQEKASDPLPPHVPVEGKPISEEERKIREIRARFLEAKN